MLKTVVPKFGPNSSTRLKHIAEKQVPTELKPIVVHGLHLYGTFFIPWEAFSQGVGSHAAVIIPSRKLIRRKVAILTFHLIP